MIRLIALLMLMTFSRILFGQQIGNDTALFRTAYAHALALYERSGNERASLYNGSEYVEPRPSTDDTHAFFLSDDWTTGSVGYQGQQFHNVSMMYDLFRDKVVIELSNAVAITLITEKVTFFTIQGHMFVYANEKTSKPGLPRSGFYDQLYNGPTGALALREKKAYEKIESVREIKHGYVEKSRYYILHREVYHQVRNKSSLLKLFHDKKSDLKKFIRSNKLDFRHSWENSLVKVAAFYDDINH